MRPCACCLRICAFTQHKQSIIEKGRSIKRKSSVTFSTEKMNLLLQNTKKKLFKLGLPNRKALKKRFPFHAAGHPNVKRGKGMTVLLWNKME